MYFYYLCKASYTSILYVRFHIHLFFMCGIMYFYTLCEATCTSILYVRLHILLHILRLHVYLNSMSGFIYFM